MAAGLAACPACGIDVALAAVLLERQALGVIPAAPGTPFVGDAMLSRFGEFLMKRGYITSGQLEAALGRQRELAGTGVRETLGQVLLEMGVMTREQLELASVEQVQELQSALRAGQRPARTAGGGPDAGARTGLPQADRAGPVEGQLHLERLARAADAAHEDQGVQCAAGRRRPRAADSRAAAGGGGDGPRGERVGAARGDLIQFATGARGEMVLRTSAVPVAAAARTRRGGGAGPRGRAGPVADVPRAGAGRVASRRTPRSCGGCSTSCSTTRSSSRRPAAASRRGPSARATASASGCRTPGRASPRRACRNCSSRFTSSTGPRRDAAAAPGSASRW